MALTKERAELLGAYLNEDLDRTKRLADLTAEEAIAEINGDGNDFTVEELQDFAEQIQAMNVSQEAEGELEEGALDNVAGGVVVSTGILAIVGAGAILWGCAKKKR